MKTSEKLFVIGYGRDCDGVENKHITRYTCEDVALEMALQRSESGDGERYQAVDEKTAREYCNQISREWPLIEFDIDGTPNHVVPNYQFDNNRLDYTHWLITLVALICEDADIRPEQLSFDEKDCRAMYDNGFSPARAYFDEWQQDAGHFFAL